MEQSMLNKNEAELEHLGEFLAEVNDIWERFLCMKFLKLVIFASDLCVEVERRLGNLK